MAFAKGEVRACLRSRRYSAARQESVEGNSLVAHRVRTVMRIRLTSLVLVLMLSGSALGGIPMQFAEQSCGMDHAMADMDCCEAALMPNRDAHTATARLCCVLNCSREGTAPTNAL